MKKLLIVAAIIIAPVALSACNTVDGLGQDIERAGEKIQDL